MSVHRISWLVVGVSCLSVILTLSSAASAARSNARTAKPAGHAATRPAATAPAPQPANPLLPSPAPVEAFFPDLSLIQRTPTVTPQGFEPLYSGDDWQLYRDKLGVEADGISRLKSSGQIEFAEKLITAAGTAPTQGTKRLVLIRAAAIAYRSAGGFPTADKAVTAYAECMDRQSASQVGALWTMANALSRTSVTPKPDRIRYDAIAAKANMQLSLLLLGADQVEAAQAVTRQIAYHEGWLHNVAGEATTRIHIAQVRATVRQYTAMMDYLATQYAPAVNNDDGALLAIYLYGRCVKGSATLVADLPARKPDSPMAQLAASLDAAGRDPMAAFQAGENLRIVAATLPDGILKQRTLYAALQNYRVYLAAPQTERDRIRRTLARIHVEAVITDGARGPSSLDPFAQPATPPEPAVPVLADGMP